MKKIQVQQTAIRFSISIIVPVYNTELFLPRCIDSVLTQTFVDYECILVDDGSTDSSPQICDEYAKGFPKINYYTLFIEGFSV
jgi:glycosyltransferase involved in cell wall biosynthesis